jgi:hypothetical protein
VASYSKNSVVRLTATFKDTTNALVDPTTVVCNVVNPNGSSSTPSVVKDSLGTYHADVVADTPGTWGYQFIGTGTNRGADEGEFEVARSRFG